MNGAMKSIHKCAYSQTIPGRTNNRMQSDKIGRCAPNFAADAKRYNARESGVGGNRGGESKSSKMSGI